MMTFRKRSEEPVVLLALISVQYVKGNVGNPA